MLRGRTDGENGASLVEFTLVLPIFFALVLGTFTGGVAYSVRQSVTQAARESARAGATLPVTTTVNEWLDTVANIAAGSSDGELAPGKSGRELCVALIDGATSTRRVSTGTAAPVYEAGTCFSDGLGADQPRRVQVLAERTRDFQALFFSRALTLRGEAVSRYEVP